MANENQTTAFPDTQKDISNLKQTATDAASDLGNAAAHHADKAKRQVKDLAQHATDEGMEQVSRVTGQAGDVLGAVKQYISDRPFASVGVALLAGYIYGRRSAS